MKDFGLFWVKPAFWQLVQFLQNHSLKGLTNNNKQINITKMRIVRVRVCRIKNIHTHSDTDTQEYKLAKEFWQLTSLHVTTAEFLPLTAEDESCRPGWHEASVQTDPPAALKCTSSYSKSIYHT